MNIISPFKDYYDFLAYTYGVDKNITYNRQCFVDVEHLQIQNTAYTTGASSTPCINLELTSDVYDVPTYIKSGPFGHKYSYDFVHKNVLYKFHHILVLGSLFLCIEQTYPEKLPFFRIAKFQDVLMYQEQQITKSRKFRNFELHADTLYRNNKGFTVRVDNYKDRILKMHKALGIPIISGIVSDPRTNIIYKVYQPNLSQIQGFGGIVTPHELYQQLTNFFVELKGNTDLDPPVVVDNNSKIQKHGFDTKTSFRHPVNIRKLKR